MESETERMKREHPLCTEEGLALFVGLLSYSGAMCPKCGHGTRRTSKRWAKCKKCGERVERRSLDSIQVSAKERTVGDELDDDHRRDAP